MKILLIPLVLFSQFLYSQPVDNFVIKGNLVVWEKEITAESFKSLLVSIKESGTLINVESDSTQIRGELRPGEADYKGAGYQRMNVPMNLLSTLVHGFVVIKYDKGNASISIKRIEFEEENDSPFF